MVSGPHTLRRFISTLPSLCQRIKQTGYVHKLSRGRLLFDDEFLQLHWCSCVGDPLENGVFFLEKMIFYFISEIGVVSLLQKMR